MSKAARLLARTPIKKRPFGFLAVDSQATHFNRYSVYDCEVEIRYENIALRLAFIAFDPSEDDEEGEYSLIIAADDKLQETFGIKAFTHPILYSQVCFNGDGEIDDLDIELIDERLKYLKEVLVRIIHSLIINKILEEEGCTESSDQADVWDKSLWCSWLSKRDIRYVDESTDFDLRDTILKVNTLLGRNR